MTIQQWDQILQIVILVMTTIIIPVVGYYISQFLNHHAALLKNQRTARAAKMLVSAAEQIFPDPKNGPEKENYVSLLLKKWFPSLTDDEIMALVHASVLALHEDLNVLQTISSSSAEITPSITLTAPEKNDAAEGDNPPYGLSPTDKLL